MKTCVSLQVSNLTKKYGKGESEIIALNNVSFELYAGEFVVILGPSGSGKSTLLNIIGGMDNATSGNVVVGDTNVTQSKGKDLVYYRKNKIGFVFQFYNLMGNLTAIENIELATNEHSLKAEDALSLVGLANRKNNFPSQLSGGEQQRVAVARAIVKRPEILLCDEPTGALDSKTGKNIVSLLLDLTKKDGRTTIVVTHNSKLAEVADRVIRISDGCIVSNEIQEKPKQVEEIEW